MLFSNTFLNFFLFFIVLDFVFYKMFPKIYHQEKKF